jgi:MarR family transcriptional regulator, 2-MHQ and catechol-resistance regulon repressor
MNDTVSGVRLWLVLWRASRAVEARAARSIEALGMCLSDFAALEALLHKGPLTVGALGEKVLLTSGSMTAAVDRLERRGLVERRSDPQDRRARVIHLTGAGRALGRKLFAAHELDMEAAVSALTSAERATLLELLRKLGHGAGA